MKEKWKKQNGPRISDGHPIPQRLVIITEPVYKPKFLTKSPSLRAIRNYNDVEIDESTTMPAYENLTFIPETGVGTPPLIAYDYATTSTGSEMESERNETGSTIGLAPRRIDMTWFTHLETIICTISLAANFGNLYRLPQATIIHGSLPFLIAYTILTLIVGLPLLFLELGIGQLAQEGFIKSWRAVPFFKGVGYVKLVAVSLIAIHHSLYIGLAIYFIVWLAKGPVPFQECAIVRMKEDGYAIDARDGQQCLRKTFLEVPYENPYWYGIFAAILFGVWIITTILSIRRTKSFIRSLSVLFFPTIACLIALTVRAVFVQQEFDSVEKLIGHIEWDMIYNAEVWYYALIQVFFSTKVGFGSFVTSAGIIYNKVNPLWTALGYIAINLLYGVGSIFIFYILTENLDITPKPGDTVELHLIALIYNVLTIDESADVRVWTIVVFVFIALSGFISMANLTYTLLKAITVENKKKLKWWQTSIVSSFIGFVASCAILLQHNFELVHLLDHYIIGNLILISVIIEVLAMIVFYGTERIKSDFEFMLGHILSKFWLVIWWILPFLLISIFIWALVTLHLKGLYIEDSEWIYGTGWGVVLSSILLIFVISLHSICGQDGYTFVDKVKGSFKPSQNWGPKDPMLRHTWVQWNSKAQQGERDFTLKRKGTRDYTKSIKRSAKKASLAGTENGGYVNSESATLPKTADYIRPLKVSALVDDTNGINGYYPGEFNQKNLNPLARNDTNYVHEGSNSEGYGTFRKGPYVIPDNDVPQHVCHRKYSQYEDATEL